MISPGWPAILTDGPVILRPYRRRDASTWVDVRLRNRRWLSTWEPTPAAHWEEINSRASFRYLLRDLQRSALEGTTMPFGIFLRHGDGGPHPAERFVGHIALANIVRRALGSGDAGYWIDESVAGQGIMPTALALLVDHAFGSGGLHRVEVNIRPENQASRRVVEKLGFREEAYRQRFLHIDGAWRDHVGYALTTEDVAADGGLLARWHRVRQAAR